MYDCEYFSGCTGLAPQSFTSSNVKFLGDTEFFIIDEYQIPLNQLVQTPDYIHSYFCIYTGDTEWPMVI